jgi:hypothetical protein
MISTEILFRIIVLMGLIRASRYSINTPKVCASIWLIARFFSGVFDRQDLWVNALESLIATAFAWWMFTLIKRYDKWTSQWIGICGVGIVVLGFVL